MIDNKVLNSALEDRVRQLQDLTLILEVQHLVSTGHLWLLIHLQDSVLDIFKVRLVDEDDLAVFEVLEFLSEMRNT